MSTNTCIFVTNVSKSDIHHLTKRQRWGSRFLPVGLGRLDEQESIKGSHTNFIEVRYTLSDTKTKHSVHMHNMVICMTW